LSLCVFCLFPVGTVWGSQIKVAYRESGMPFRDRRNGSA